MEFVWLGDEQDKSPARYDNKPWTVVAYRNTPTGPVEVSDHPLSRTRFFEFKEQAERQAIISNSVLKESKKLRDKKLRELHEDVDFYEPVIRSGVQQTMNQNYYDLTGGL